MFDESREDAGVTDACVGDERPDWKEADRALRRIAARRAGLDAEEARWLLVARAAGAHVECGFATFGEYIEHVLGYGPRTLADRLRVAEALQTLPATRDALATGRISYSAARELTHVVKAATEGTWLARASGRTAREVQAMVSGHKPGDLPDDPTDPDLRTFALRFELPPELMALFRDARQHVIDEAGEQLTDEEVLAAMCRAALSHGPESGRKKPPHQLAITVCESCSRGWQQGAGELIEVGRPVIEQARCDATEVGRVDAEVPTLAAPTIPLRIRNQVMRRDHGRCVVPGCRSSRHLEVHHLQPRATGGGNELWNLAVLCGGHHRALHHGRLVITGRPGALTFTHDDGRPWGTPPPQPAPSVEEDVRLALCGLGFKRREAEAALHAASAHVGSGGSLEDWLRAALRAAGRASG